jgi:octaprenyl-diphosphate synthase
MQQFAQAKKDSSLPMGAYKIFDLIKVELRLVEEEFERQASSNIQVVNYLGEYLRQSGGKRIRPALLILSNYAAGGNARDDKVIRLATVMEMLHTATLVHDDIIDNADVRRGRSSVNARFGNQTAVLMGDWLYMSAFETTVKERSLEIIDILTRLTRKMTEGELIQLTTIGRLDISEGEYFDILERKTAFLFSACCEVGAILAGADRSRQEAMRDYGMNLGIAFQIADDILDITSENDQLGKAAGSDLLDGKLTLPFVSLLQKEPSLLPEFEKIMLDGEYADFSRDDLKQKLTDHGILDEIREKAKTYALCARKSIDVLPETEYRSSLEEILEFIIDRSS